MSWGGDPTDVGRFLITADDAWLFNEGSHTRLHEKLGAHPRPDGTTVFGVWAPNATRVSVVGDFNHWQPGADVLVPRLDSGIWQGVVGGAAVGHRYKFHVESAVTGYTADKADPFAAWAEPSPRTASVVWDLDHAWGDGAWMADRGAKSALDAPIAIYELHVGSWKHAADEHRSLNYRELAPVLADYVVELGFTHVELLPVMEYPFYGSWGYQTTGYFAPTSRFGTPQEFMELVDHLHQRGIGVILDWVPSHFPDDLHGLGLFDGTALFEHADPRLGRHPDWDSLIFDYDRPEVRSFLLSSAHSWLDRYHADGIRVDAVASMLYLDYSRKEGEWIPNRFGGHENLGALQFLRKLNESVYASFPGVQTFAEESTAWPLVSRPVDVGGLGFGFKWDMGWMHDTLQHFEREPLYRRYHHGELTFRLAYAFNENFCLPLSHDEVVHGKRSLVNKMPGDRWQRFANLRLLYGYQYGQPGKKLLFMGDELAQELEWDHDTELQWGLLAQHDHQGVQRWVGDLNRLHRTEPALHELDASPEGFRWVVADDEVSSVLAFRRLAASGARDVVVACNFTPVPRHDYRMGVPAGGPWAELLNSDALHYGGSGIGNAGVVEAEPVAMHGERWSLSLTLPPLAVLFLARS